MNNERELEKAGYDNWKLSNNEDGIMKKKGHFYFNNGLEIDNAIGECPCCEEDIFDNQLFVECEETDKQYHLSCFNYMIKEREEEDDK